MQNGRRVAAAVVVAIAAGGLVLDFAGDYWINHPFLASLLVNLLTLALAVALVEWWLERRRTHAWYRLSALAYDGLINGVRGAWMASLIATGVSLARPIDELKEAARRAPNSIRERADDSRFRVQYADQLQPAVDELGQAIRNWAGIMTTDDEQATDINDAADLWQRLKNSQFLLRGDPLADGTWPLRPAEFVEFVDEANQQALELDSRFWKRILARRRSVGSCWQEGGPRRASAVGSR